MPRVSFFLPRGCSMRAAIVRGCNRASDDARSMQNDDRKRWALRADCRAYSMPRDDAMTR